MFSASLRSAFIHSPLPLCARNGSHCGGSSWPTGRSVAQDRGQERNVTMDGSGRRIKRWAGCPNAAGWAGGLTGERAREAPGAGCISCFRSDYDVQPCPAGRRTVSLDRPDVRLATARRPTDRQSFNGYAVTGERSRDPNPRAWTPSRSAYTISFSFPAIVYFVSFL